MKKVISVLAVVVLVIMSLTVTVFAYGGRGKSCRAAGQTRYALCEVKDCDTLGPHRHGDDWYCSQNWQGDFAACTVDGCAQAGLHEHNGAYYRCTNFGVGNGCGRRH